MNVPKLPRFPLITTSVCLLLLLGGCRKPEVTYYQVPHEAPAQNEFFTQSTPAPSVAAAPQQGAPALEWHKPAAWSEKPGSDMRLGSYGYTAADGSEADISVTSFPDAAGGLLANINRWRGQVDLAPITEGDLPSTAERIEIAHLPGWFVDFAGTADGQPARLIGGIVAVGGNSWFFKMIGPEAVVASQRDTFREWIGSVHAVTPAAAPPATASLSSSSSMTGSVPAPPAPEGIDFTVPDGWQEQPGNAFRAASFLIPGPGVPAADVSVSAFPGSVGGDLANVNRWRAQLNLQPIDASTLASIGTSLEGNGLTFHVYDLVSAGPALEGGHRARILAAILKRDDKTWFFKVTGEAGHVAEQRGNFESFLRSFQFKQEG